MKAQEIIEPTSHLPKVSGLVRLDVEFILPADKFPADLPCGPDLDNLLKRLLDGLWKTIFSDVNDGDSSVVDLHVSKCRVRYAEDPGARIVLWNVYSPLPQECSLQR